MGVTFPLIKVIRVIRTLVTVIVTCTVVITICYVIFVCPCVHSGIRSRYLEIVVILCRLAYFYAADLLLPDYLLLLWCIAAISWHCWSITHFSFPQLQ